MSLVGQPGDPEERLAARAKLVGVGLQTVGILGGIFGLFLFGAVFFDGDPQPSVVAPAIGFALMLATPALWFAGKRNLPALAPGPGPEPARAIIEVLQSDHDGAQYPPFSVPASPVAVPKLQHDCGAWNEPGAAFCKRCGRALSSRVCPTCRTRNDPDARFCGGCGSPMGAGGLYA